MSNWDDNSWVLYDDNLVGLLVKPGPTNEFELESFDDDDQTRWRVKYVPSATRTMKNFWYQCVFDERGAAPPPTPAPVRQALTEYPGNEQSWDDTGDAVKAIADAAGTQYQCLQTMVTFQTTTHKLKLVRFSNVLTDGGDFLYVRLRPVYSTGSVAAPDGGGIGRQK